MQTIALNKKLLNKKCELEFFSGTDNGTVCVFCLPSLLQSYTTLMKNPTPLYLRQTALETWVFFFKIKYLFNLMFLNIDLLFLKIFSWALISACELNFPFDI